MKRAIAIAVLLIASSIVFAWQAKSLSGTYRIGGQTIYDPPENEPQDTHLYIELTGLSAKDLYEKMKVTPVPDVCEDKGKSKTNTVGEMQCTRGPDGKDYRCWFGVDIKNQHIVKGVIC